MLEARSGVGSIKSFPRAGLKSKLASSSKSSTGLQNKTFYCETCDVHVNSETQLKQVSFCPHELLCSSVEFKEIRNQLGSALIKMMLIWHFTALSCLNVSVSKKRRFVSITLASETETTFTRLSHQFFINPKKLGCNFWLPPAVVKAVRGAFEDRWIPAHLPRVGAQQEEDTEESHKSQHDHALYANPVFPDWHSNAHVVLWNGLTWHLIENI